MTRLTQIFVDNRILLRLFYIFLLFIIILFFLSCKKEEGEGGMATIVGKVYIKNYTSPPCPCALIEEYYAQGENVYIIYGDDKGVSDSKKTSFDGYFEFKYLRTGHYKVWSLSKDTTSTSNSKTVEKLVEVKITKKDEVVTLSDIVIVK